MLVPGDGGKGISRLRLWAATSDNFDMKLFNSGDYVGSMEQKALAEALNEGVHEYVDIPDRGVTYRDDLDTLTSEQVHCPAVLFETGAIRADNKTLTTQCDDYGKGLAAGMCRYLGIPAGF